MSSLSRPLQPLNSRSASSRSTSSRTTSSSTTSSSRNRENRPTTKTTTTSSTTGVKRKLDEKSTISSNGTLKVSKFDAEGKLKELEKHMFGLRERVVQAEQNVSVLQQQIAEKEVSISSVEIVKSDIQENIQQQRTKLQQSEYEKQQLYKHLETLRFQNQLQLDEKDQLYRSLQLQNDALSNQYQSLQNELKNSKSKILSIESEIVDVQSQMQVTSSKLKESDKIASERLLVIQSIQREIDLKNAEIHELELQSNSDDQIRRKLQNSIQELKGNIRVICRIKPFYEQTNDSQIDYELPDKFQHQNININAVVNGIQKKINYKFDKILLSSAQQLSVFEEFAESIQSTLFENINLAIYVYGKSGSGKTYSTIGPKNPTLNERGLISQSVHSLFDQSSSSLQGYDEVAISVSYFEINGDKIVDLFGADDVYNPDIVIKNNIVHVSKIQRIELQNCDQIDDLLSSAIRRRSDFQSTSRVSTDFVFQLFINGKKGNEKIESMMSIVELSSSDRKSNSFIAFNELLSAVANRSTDLSFDQSLFTSLLRPHFASRSKNLMLLNLSLSMNDLDDTLNSLRFASKVNSVEISSLPPKKSKKNQHNNNNY